MDVGIKINEAVKAACDKNGWPVDLKVQGAVDNLVKTFQAAIRRREAAERARVALDPHAVATTSVPSLQKMTAFMLANDGFVPLAEMRKFLGTGYELQRDVNRVMSANGWQTIRRRVGGTPMVGFCKRGSASKVIYLAGPHPENAEHITLWSTLPAGLRSLRERIAELEAARKLLD